MNIIERKYRLANIAEDLEHVSSKVDKVQEGSANGGDKDQLESLKFHLKRAVEIAYRVGCPQTRQELTTLLEASIRGVEEKTLTGAMASASQVEKAHVGKNVSPFLKPLT